MKRLIIYEKLSQYDIEKIITDYLSRKYADLFYSKVEFLGSTENDLRCVCAVCDKDVLEHEHLDLIDEIIKYTKTP